MKNFPLILLVSVLSAISSVTVYKYFEGPREVVYMENNPARLTTFTDQLFSGNSQREFVSSAPTDFISAAERVTPAVVNIKSSQGGDGDFWSSGSYGGSSGSGIIISPEGFVLTNNHVIEDAKKVEVTLNDKRKFKAKIVGTDTSTDLALLKIDEKDLPFLTFGNSDSVRVGEWVMAVGNPFNLESTVTAGIVSAKGRNINILEDLYSIESFIQTDAAVNPGNSGGALVNTNGELVGVNTAIITRSGRYEGYSFAVPANLAQKVVRDLKDFGEVQRGMLGIGIDDVNDDRAKYLGLENAAGVYIKETHDDSAAGDAGLKKGDVIISINRKKIASVPELKEQVARFRPGNTISIEYIRDRKKYTTEVTLKNRSDKKAKKVADFKGDTRVLEDLGFELRNLRKDETRKLGIIGIKVKSIFRNSVIEETNMDPGFIITRVNDNKVTTIEDLIDELEGFTGQVVLEGIYEKYPGEYYYKFPL